jgi:hypothetical protein
VSWYSPRDTVALGPNRLKFFASRPAIQATFACVLCGALSKHRWHRAATLCPRSVLRACSLGPTHPDSIVTALQVSIAVELAGVLPGDLTVAAVRDVVRLQRPLQRRGAFLCVSPHPMSRSARGIHSLLLCCTTPLASLFESACWSCAPSPHQSNKVKIRK